MLCGGIVGYAVALTMPLRNTLYPGRFHFPWQGSTWNFSVYAISLVAVVPFVLHSWWRCPVYGGISQEWFAKWLGHGLAGKDFPSG